MKQTEQQKEMEQFRLKVLENEMIARFNKSEYEKMYYYLEAKKIAPVFMESAKEDEAERIAFNKSITEQIEAQVGAQNQESTEA